MSFARYPAYKDSGVAWLGEVPAHWEVPYGRRVYRQIREPALSSDVQLSATQKYGVIPQADFMEAEDQKVMLALKGLSSFKHVERDDFVISLRSFQGGIEHSAYDGCVSPAYTVLRANAAVVPRFIAYTLKSSNYISALQSRTDGIRDGKNISYDQFGEIGLPLPPNEEQVAIAAFLDRETAKIDALVAEQERLIMLLKEKRQAVVSHAVTKGLDPSVPMKDSGVEWLGEVPAHWSVLRLRYAAKLNPSKQEIANQDRATEVSFIPMEAIEEDGSLNLDRARSIGEVETGYTYFRDGDVAIAKITPCFENGKGAVMVGLTKGIGFGTTELIIVRPIEELVSSGYLDRMFRSHPFRQLGEAAMYGAGGQKRVPDDFVRNFAIGIPPRAEQTTISAFLHNEAAKLDGLVEKARLTIDLLQERRSALISAAVTGQIDVRGLADRMTTPDSIAAHADSTPTQGRFDSESAEHAA